jgi:hypothetical protein
VVTLFYADYFEKCDGYLSRLEALLKFKVQVTLMELYVEKACSKTNYFA